MVRAARLWRRKSPYREFEARPSHSATGKLCQPSRKWVPFSNLGRIRQQKERDGLCLSSFHQLCPRYSRTLTPTAIMLWEAYTFFTCLSLSLTDTSSLKYCLKEPLNHNQPVIAECIHKYLYSIAISTMGTWTSVIHHVNWNTIHDG